LSNQETWPGAGDLMAAGDVATAREGDLTQLKVKLPPESVSYNLRGTHCCYNVILDKSKIA